MRANIIKTKLKIVEENILLVKENLPEKIEDFTNLGLIKDGSYKRIEASIQEILSICSIINTDLKLGVPPNRDEILKTLIDNNIISEKMGQIVKELKGFRNFLVYRYGKLQDEIAFENIKKGLLDFKFFNDEILQFLKRKNFED